MGDGQRNPTKEWINVRCSSYKTLRQFEQHLNLTGNFSVNFYPARINYKRHISKNISNIFYLIGCQSNTCAPDVTKTLHLISILCPKISMWANYEIIQVVVV